MSIIAKKMRKRPTHAIPQADNEAQQLAEKFLADQQRLQSRKSQSYNPKDQFITDKKGIIIAKKEEIKECHKNAGVLQKELDNLGKLLETNYQLKSIV